MAGRKTPYYSEKKRQSFSVYMKDGQPEQFQKICQDSGLQITTVLGEFIKQIIDGEIVFCMGNRRLEFYYKDKLTGEETLWKDI